MIQRRIPYFARRWRRYNLCSHPLQNETISAPFTTICTSPYAQPPQWTFDSCLCKLANQNPFFHCTEYKRQSNECVRAAVLQGHLFSRWCSKICFNFAQCQIVLEPHSVYSGLKETYGDMRLCRRIEKARHMCSHFCSTTSLDSDCPDNLTGRQIVSLYLR